MSSDVDRLIARQNRQDRLVVALVAAFLAMAVVAMASLYAVSRLAEVVDRNADELHERNEAVEQLTEFEDQARCALVVQARFLLRAGEALTVDHSKPDTSAAVQDAILRATEDLRRFNAGESPCDIADNPT